MNKLKSFILIFLVFLSGCYSTGGIRKFYKMDYGAFNLPYECYLQDSEEPQVFYSSNIERDISLLQSQNWMILGYADWNGPYKKENKINRHLKNMCFMKKAHIALYSYKYTHTRYGAYVYKGYAGVYEIDRYDYTVVFFVKQPKGNK